MATKKAAAKSATKKAGKKAGKAEGQSADDEQEPLDKFRVGAAAAGEPETELTNEDQIGGVTQLRAPGMERKRYPKIEKQALLVEELQTKRLEAAAEEKKARDLLTKMMETEGFVVGDHIDLPGDYEAVLDAGDPKAKVHKKKVDK